MRAKNLAVLVVVFFFILSLSAPVFSSSGNMRYDKYYDLEGRILLMIQAGDKDFSPAQQKTLVEGRGEFKRGESVFLDSGDLRVIADSDWSVDEELLRGLSVGSTIKLNEELVDLSGKEAEQVFAVMVESGPGEEGHLLQDWDLYELDYDDQAENGENGGEPGIRFAIDQDAFTSGGEMKRYIDLVPPGSDIYLFEDSEVRGYARVVDSLQAGEEEGKDATVEDEPGKENSGPDAGLLTATGEKEGEAGSDAAEKDATVFFLQNDQFETTVPVGTPREEIEPDQTVSLKVGLIEITGIEVEWEKDSVPAYDPDREGSYVFAGRLNFPEPVLAPDNMILLYTVHVGEEQETGTEDGPDAGENIDIDDAGYVGVDAGEKDEDESVDDQDAGLTENEEGRERGSGEDEQ